MNLRVLHNKIYKLSVFNIFFLLLVTILLLVLATSGSTQTEEFLLATYDKALAKSESDSIPTLIYFILMMWMVRKLEPETLAKQRDYGILTKILLLLK